jgi:hypothetical protein
MHKYLFDKKWRETVPDSLESSLCESFNKVEFNSTIEGLCSDLVSRMVLIGN